MQLLPGWNVVCDCLLEIYPTHYMFIKYFGSVWTRHLIVTVTVYDAQTGVIDLLFKPQYAQYV
jgi:hypothetical protein